MEIDMFQAPIRHVSQFDHYRPGAQSGYSTTIKEKVGPFS